MARIDEEPDERDQQPLRLSQLVDCSECGTTQDIVFVAQEGVYELQDLTEPPETTWICTGCGYEAEATYSAWSGFNEA